jgi:RNA polymerase sigma-70 factor (ECF subfamily)
VAQEAFLRAWRHAGAYDARRGAVSTWLLVITRNLALDVIRLHRTLPVDPDFIIALPNAENEDGPEEKGIAAEQARRVREAVAALPEGQQRALILATIYGRTAREIGEAEGIPLGTAKTRIRSALLKLRSTLRADGH